jgi:hypothetical protein
MHSLRLPIARRDEALLILNKKKARHAAFERQHAGQKTIGNRERHGVATPKTRVADRPDAKATA